MTKTRLRELALAAANERQQRIFGRDKFCRVAPSFYLEIERQIARLVADRAVAHWQKGKTLQ